MGEAASIGMPCAPSIHPAVRCVACVLPAAHPPQWVYLLIPIVSGLVGWFTNWLAIVMTFYPIEVRVACSAAGTGSTGLAEPRVPHTTRRAFAAVLAVEGMAG